MGFFSSGSKRWRPTKVDKRQQQPPSEKPPTLWGRVKKWVSNQWTSFLQWMGWRKPSSPVAEKPVEFLTESGAWDIEKIQNKTQFVSIIPTYERKKLITVLEMAQAPLQPIENLSSAQLKKLLTDFIFLNAWVTSEKATPEDKAKQASLQAYIVSEYIYFVWTSEYQTDDVEKQALLRELFILADNQSDEVSVKLMAESFLIKAIDEIKTAKPAVFLTRWEHFCESSVYKKLTREFRENARTKIQEAKIYAAQAATVQLFFTEGRFDDIQQHLPKESEDLIKTLVLSLKNDVIAEIESRTENDAQFKKLKSFIFSTVSSIVLSKTDNYHLQNFYENILSSKKMTQALIELFELVSQDLSISDTFLKSMEGKQLIWAGSEMSKQAFSNTLRVFIQLDTTSLLQKSLVALVANIVNEMTPIRVFIEKGRASLFSEQWIQRIRESISFSANKAKEYIREKLMGEAFPFRSHSSVAWAFERGSVQEKTEAEINAQLTKARNPLGREKGEYLGGTDEWVNVNHFKYHYALAFQIELNNFMAHTDYSARDGAIRYRLQRLEEFLKGLHAKLGKHAEADGTFDHLTIDALGILRDVIATWKTGKAPEKTEMSAANQSFFSRRSRSRSRSPVTARASRSSPSAS